MLHMPEKLRKYENPIDFLTNLCYNKKIRRHMRTILTPYTGYFAGTKYLKLYRTLKLQFLQSIVNLIYVTE